MPFVGGTVDSQRSPNVIPKIIELNKDGGEKINTQILTALRAYKMLNRFFCLWVSNYTSWNTYTWLYAG